jgi:hypothetical protein
LALALSIAQWAIAGTYIAHAANLSLVGFVPVMIVGFMGVGIILKAAQLAQAIGGTITTTSGSLLLAGTIGGAMGSTLSTFKMPISGMKTTSSLLQGNDKDNRKSKSSTMDAIRHNMMKAQR